MAPRDRLPVTIGARNFLMDLMAYRREPVDSVRQMQDASAEPGEQSLSVDTVWKRTAKDFRGGIGQRIFDAEDSARDRAWSAYGFDMTRPRALRLTQALRRPVAQNTASASAGCNGTSAGQPISSANFCKVLVAGASRPTVYLVMYQTAVEVYKVDPDDLDSDGTQWTVTRCTGGDLAGGFGFDGGYCTDGANLYVAMNGGLVKITGTTGSNFSTQDCSVVQYCAGRLIGAFNGELFELSNTGTKTSIYTHHLGSSWVWTSIEAGDAGIFAAGYASTSGRSEIYCSKVDDQTGAVEPPIPAASMPAGEIVRTMCFSAGVLVIGTSRGVRIGNVASSGTITYGPLIPLWRAGQNVLDVGVTTGTTSMTVTTTLPGDFPQIGDLVTIEGEKVEVTAFNVGSGSLTVTRGIAGTATDHDADTLLTWESPPQDVGVAALAAYGNLVYVGWTRANSSESGVAVLNLAKFVADMQPALSPGPTSENVAYPVSSIAVWPGEAPYYTPRLAVGFDRVSAAGGGPMISSMTESYSIISGLGYGAHYLSGRVTFGTPERKAFLSLELAYAPLPPDCQVNAFIRKPDGSRVQVFVDDVDGSTGKSGTIDFEGEWVEVEILLYGAQGIPEIERWTLRAVPLPFRGEHIRVPVILVRELEDDGSRLEMDPWADWNYLHGLFLNRGRVTYAIGNETGTAIVDGLYLTGEGPVSLTRWTKDRDWMEGTWIVDLLTVDGGAL